MDLEDLAERLRHEMELITETVLALGQQQGLILLLCLEGLDGRTS